MNQFDRSFSPLSVWMVRLAFSALLVIASEILLWSTVPQHSLSDWVIIIVGQIALSALVLDLIVRYRVREIYSAMVVFIIYAVLSAQLVNPGATLYQFPDTLITRVIGGNATFGLEMFGLLLFMLNRNQQQRHRLLLLGYSIWLGYYFGIWMHWSPTLGDMPTVSVSLTTALFYAAIPLSIATFLNFTLRSTDPNRTINSEGSLKLTLFEWGLFSVTVILLLMVRGLHDQVDGLSLLATFGLIALCYGILWSQRPETGASLLAHWARPNPRTLIWLLIGAGLFSGIAVLSYDSELLEIADYNRFTLIELLFITVGFTWLPLAGSVIGLRAVDRHARTNRW